MADKALTTSRRGVIAGLAIAPLAAASVAADANPGAAAIGAAAMNMHTTITRATSAQTAWDDAMGRLIDAKAAEVAYQRRFYEPSYQATVACERANGLSEDSDWEAVRAFWAKHPDQNQRHRAIAEEYERLSNATWEVQQELIAMPAASADGLRWKLDYIFADNGDGDGFMSSWSVKFIAQTVNDYRRLLGGAS